MNKIQIRALLFTAALSLAFVGGCGKSSSTDSDTESTSTKNCGKGKSCKGTYSTSISDSKEWSAVCTVNQIDSGVWTKLWFEEANNCGFDWIRAQGIVGTDWATLASGTDREFMIQYTGEDVFQIRLCTNGANADGDACL